MSNSMATGAYAPTLQSVSLARGRVAIAVSLLCLFALLPWYVWTALALVLVLAISASMPEVSIPTQYAATLLLSLALLIVGCAGAFGSADIHPVIRDFYFFERTALLLVAGLLVAKWLRIGWRDLSTAVLLAGLIVSLAYALEFLVSLHSGKAAFAQIRKIFEGDPFLLAPAAYSGLLLTLDRRRSGRRRGAAAAQALLTLFVVATTIFVASRTLVGVMTIFLFCAAIAAGRRGWRVLLLSLLALCIGVYLFSLVDASALGSFWRHLSGSSPSLSGRALNSYYSIQHGWRTYEAEQVLHGFTTASLPHLLAGYGFGSSVPIGYGQLLDGHLYYSLPWLHDGYLLALWKTGLVGLFLVAGIVLSLVFECRATWRSRAKSAAIEQAAIALSMVFSTAVVGGFFAYKDGQTMLLLFGMLSGAAGAGASSGAAPRRWLRRRRCQKYALSKAGSQPSA